MVVKFIKLFILGLARNILKIRSIDKMKVFVQIVALFAFSFSLCGATFDDETLKKISKVNKVGYTLKQLKELKLTHKIKNVTYSLESFSAVLPKKKDIKKKKGVLRVFLDLDAHKDGAKRGKSMYKSRASLIIININNEEKYTLGLKKKNIKFRDFCPS
jgi:hypothetical protein